MKRLKKLILWDLKFQLKYNIFLAAVMMASLWTFIVYMLPKSTMPIAFPIVFITDFAVCGFLLLSAMIFFEKGQNSLQALLTTPVKISEYILSKVLSLSFTLTVLALILSIIISFLKDIETNLFFAVLSAFISCSFFVIVGLIASTFFKSFTDLILPMGIFFALAFVPFLSYVNSPNLDFLDYIFWLFPTYYMLNLVNAITKDYYLITIIMSTIVVLAFDFVLFKVAVNLFDKKIMGRGN